MAVNFFTSEPKALLDSFNEGIAQDNPKGKILTWVKDKDGDYTHVAENWKNKAWFRPRSIDGALVFNILGRKKVAMPMVVYGFYHGHLVETFLNHFDERFSSASSTAQATKDDFLGGGEE